MSANIYARLPNFFLAGVAKSGTSSLAHYLDQHPQIYISKPKEPKFFDTAAYATGIESYVEIFFRDAQHFPVRGDATPSVFSTPHLCIPRLRAVYGARPLKFVVICREPVSRAWSHYLHAVSTGREQRPFDAAIEPDITDPNNNRFHYFRTGLYATHLRAWWQAYRREDFHILLTEDLRDHGPASLAKIFAFLDVDPDVPVDTSHRFNTAARLRSRFLANLINHPPGFIRSLARLLFPNKLKRELWRKYFRSRLRRRDKNPPPPIPPETAARLHALYREEIQDFAELIGRDLSHWLKPTE